VICALLRPLPGRRQRTFSRFAVFVSVHRGTFRIGRLAACSNSELCPQEWKFWEPCESSKTFSRFCCDLSCARGDFQKWQGCCLFETESPQERKLWSHGRKPSIGESLLQIRRLLWLLESLRQHAQGVLCHFLLPQFQQEGFYIRGGQRSRSSFQSCIRGVSFLVKFLCSPSFPLVKSCRGL